MSMALGGKYIITLAIEVKLIYTALLTGFMISVTDTTDTRDHKGRKGNQQGGDRYILNG